MNHAVKRKEKNDKKESDFLFQHFKKKASRNDWQS